MDKFGLHSNAWLYNIGKENVLMRLSFTIQMTTFTHVITHKKTIGWMVICSNNPWSGSCTRKFLDFETLSFLFCGWLHCSWWSSTRYQGLLLGFIFAECNVYRSVDVAGIIAAVRRHVREFIETLVIEAIPNRSGLRKLETLNLEGRKGWSMGMFTTCWMQ